MADRTFMLKFVGDITDAKKSLGAISTEVDKTKTATQKAFAGIGAAVSVAAVVAFGKSVVSAASDQEQAIGATSSVFKEYADQIQEFGGTTAKNLGISEAQFNQLAATTGALMKNAGVPLDEVTDSTIALTERAADMAAMFGGDVQGAMEAINSGLKGELDPLEKFGVSLKASAVDAKAAALGYLDADGKVTDYGRTQARIALIMEQSADAQGTAAREAGTVAGQTQRMSAQFKDLQADLGKKLLPVIVKLTELFRTFINFVSKNQSWVVPLAAGILAVVAAIKAWQVAQKLWTAATKVAAAMQGVWNAVIAANPIFLIVAAIAAVIAIVVLLYMKVDWFRAAVDTAVDGVVAAWNWVLDAFKTAFEWVQTNWPLLLAILTGPIGLAVKYIVDHWQAIKDGASRLVGSIRDFFARVWEIVSAPFKRAKEIIGLTITGIKEWFQKLPGQLVGYLATIWNVVSGPFKRAKETINGFITTIKDWFRKLPGQIGSLFSGLSEIVKAPFRMAFNAIKTLWNNTVGGFGFSVPSWVPGVGGKSFKIPMMAAGGIVTRPTIALIGESGAEAVVPLNRAGGFGTTIINVYALTANAEVGRKVWEALREYERTTGKAIA